MLYLVSFPDLKPAPEYITFSMEWMTYMPDDFWERTTLILAYRFYKNSSLHIRVVTWTIPCVAVPELCALSHTSVSIDAPPGPRLTTTTTRDRTSTPGWPGAPRCWDYTRMCMQIPNVSIYFLCIAHCRLYGIPGQDCVLHCCSWTLVPTQETPPTQVRLLIRVPPLQLRLQADHEFQELQEALPASVVIIDQVQKILRTIHGLKWTTILGAKNH